MSKSFKELTEKDKDFIKKVYLQSISWEKKMQKLSNKFNVSGRSIRNWVKKLGLTEKQLADSDSFKKASIRKFDKTSKRFIITWAQNDTPINKQLWLNIKAYAKFINADIHVIAGRYKNPQTQYKDGYNWHIDLTEYLDAARQQLHPRVSLLGDVKTLPTAAYPLNGHEGFSENMNCIIGHPKMHVKSLAVLEGNPDKRLFTTGAITKKNYTNSRAGKLGEFYHTYGFCVVECDGSDAHIRQVPALTNGSFIDLMNQVKDEEITRIESIPAAVLGDVHYSKMDPKMDVVTRKMLETFNPGTVVMHDVFDGQSVSHHDRRDPVLMYQKHLQGKDILKDEVDATLKYLEKYDPYNVVVVNSNHDNWVDRWLRTQDWTKDIKNAKEYAEYLAIALTGKAPKGIIPYLIEQKFGKKIKCLDRNESFKIKAYELSQHGDMGVNGSRASLNQFAKLSTKSIIAHSHCMPGGFKVQFKNKGWGEIKTVKNGDEILTYNPDTGRNEWNFVNNVIEADYDDVMYTIEGNGFHQRFTKNHKLMLRNGDYIGSADAILSRSSSELPITGLPVQNDGIMVPENIVRQIVAIAADGSMDGYRIRFHVRKQRKIDRLRMLFGDELIQYNSQNGDFDGYISKKGDIFKEISKYKSFRSKKRLTRDILKWDTSCLAILEDELRYWDGTFNTGSDGRQFSTTNKGEANIVMSALTRLGFSCRRYPKKGDQNLTVITWCVNRDYLRESKKLNYASRTKGWGFSSNHESCKVYCVEVDNKCFWTMSYKTGQVSLTGNSDGRINGCIQVGTMTPKRQAYVKGPSSIGQSHAIILPNGKVQQIMFTNHKYTTLI